jgi:predicted small lipoprotein YifL
MMKIILALIATGALSGCATPGPMKFAGPPKDAPEWQLNQGEPPITNGDLIKEPVWETR